MSDDVELGEAAVAAALTTAWLGRAYRYSPAVDSTNKQMKAWAAAGTSPAPHGAVWLADYQSAGRGRLDRRWDAPPGTALLLSVLLRPAGWPAGRGAWLTMLAGLAAAEAIEDVTGRPARLKWPNDVLLGEGETWRKAGGLLLDAALDANGGLEMAILGIGLNVNIPAGALPPAATPATSLLVELGRPVARPALLAALLARLEGRYAAADAGQSPAEDWAARLVTLGRTVDVTAAGRAPLAGTAEGVDEWGRLLVRDATGQLHTVAAGDVTLRGR